MARTMMDFINAAIELEKDDGPITLEAFSEAMRSKDTEQIEAALEKMEQAGGYENLE